MRTHLENQKGVSIVEMMVVIGLFFGLLTLVVLFMMRGKRIATRTQTLAQVQMEAVKLTRKLSEDLNRGILSGSTGQYADGSLVFLSSKPVQNGIEPEVDFDPSSGSVIWRQWVAYYLDPSTNEVRRFSKPLASYVSNPSLSLGMWDLADLPDLPSTDGRVVAKKIVEFYPTGKMLDNALEFRVKARGEVPLGNLTSDEKIVEVGISTVIKLGGVIKP